MTARSITYEEAMRPYGSAAHRSGQRAHVDLANRSPGMRVIDLASGSGEAAIRAARRVAPGGSVLGVDLSEVLLAMAREKASAGRVSNLEFRAALQKGGGKLSPRYQSPFDWRFEWLARSVHPRCAARQRPENHWGGPPAAMAYGEFVLGIHSIAVDPRDSNHFLAAVSCAAVIETIDGGKTWHGRNRGMLNDYLPDPEAEWGHDPHRLAPISSTKPKDCGASEHFCSRGTHP